MPKSRAEIAKDQRIKMLGYNIKPMTVNVPNNPEARQEVKDFVEGLKKRFNCYKF